MTRIDFHILSAPDLDAAIDHTCRLAEKAWRSGHRVLIHCDNDWAEQVDERLWSLRPDAFVPHNRLEAGDAPVNITTDTECGEHHDVMISLSHQQNPAFSRFSRLFEVVFAEDALKAAKREHYRFYQERGYPLKNVRL